MKLKLTKSERNDLKTLRKQTWTGKEIEDKVALSGLCTFGQSIYRKAVKDAGGLRAFRNKTFTFDDVLHHGFPALRWLCTWEYETVVTTIEDAAMSTPEGIALAERAFACVTPKR